MEHLKENNMDEAVKNFAQSRKPLLGICLGMQLLFESSEEFGKTAGIGLIEGRVVAFDKSKTNMNEHKIPHVGWNRALTNQISFLII